MPFCVSVMRQLYAASHIARLDFSCLQRGPVCMKEHEIQHDRAKVQINRDKLVLRANFFKRRKHFYFSLQLMAIIMTYGHGKEYRLHILLIRFVCVRFYFSLGCRQFIFYILSIFLPVFYDKSAIFMPFLRSSSFVNLLLFDKSAFYLTANQCHSEGRREAEGRQMGSRTDSQPIHSLLASCRFCKHFCQSGIMLQR